MQILSNIDNSWDFRSNERLFLNNNKLVIFCDVSEIKQVKEITKFEDLGVVMRLYIHGKKTCLKHTPGHWTFLNGEKNRGREVLEISQACCGEMAGMWPPHDWGWDGLVHHYQHTGLTTESGEAKVNGQNLLDVNITWLLRNTLLHWKQLTAY